MKLTTENEIYHHCGPQNVQANGLVWLVLEQCIMHLGFSADVKKIVDYSNLKENKPD